VTLRDNAEASAEGTPRLTTQSIRSFVLRQGRM
jgi:hypothetical protein